MSSIATDIINVAKEYISWDPNSYTKQLVSEALESNDVDTLKKMLGKRLAFGTAGLRARMGPGYSCMNDLVVIQTSQGLAMYLEEQFGADVAHERGIAIGYDHRATENGALSSKRFGLLTAAAFLQRGFKVYLMEKQGFVATPIAAFCTLHKNCVAGIMVTASHNPKEDDGYKVYWANGAQIITPHDKNIAASILKNLKPWIQYNANELNTVTSNTLCSDPTDEVADEYYKKSGEKLCFYRNKHAEWAEKDDNPKIVYTAMHGVGHQWCVRSFKNFDLPPYTPVKEQCDPDPTFPTVDFPNPEEGAGALQFAMKTANEVGATIILANDPDADRLAVAERITTTSTDKVIASDWKVFSGNEIGILFAHWMWSCYVNNNNDTTNNDGKNIYMLNSTVSSKMIRAMAMKEGFNYEDTMTGFKWMGNRTEQLEKLGNQVLFSYEEAIGFCIGDIVRDKDGVVAAAVFSEMAQYLKNEKQISITEHLDQLCQTYGYFAQYNGYLFWKDQTVINNIFNRLRNNGHYWLRVGNYKITHIRDLTDEGYDSEQKDGKPILPTSSSNMLTYTFQNGCVATFRLSGTEPKLKYYFELSDKSLEKAKERVAEMAKYIIEEMLEPAKNGLRRTL